MDEAAPLAARGMTGGEHDPDAVSRALTVPRLAWGGVYMSGHDLPAGARSRKAQSAHLPQGADPLDAWLRNPFNVPMRVS